MPLGKQKTGADEDLVDEDKCRRRFSIIDDEDLDKDFDERRRKENNLWK